ncbi:MAG: hypothetical protein ACREUP_05315, partial [Burkholderiales bacterium]
MSGAAASTIQGALVGRRDGQLQEFGQGGGSGLMQSRTHCHFDGFQIQTPCFAVTVENNTQQLVYFARDFLADRFRRFFSWDAGSAGSAGRRWQISRLTSINWPLKAWNLRNSATSRS